MKVGETTVRVKDEWVLISQTVSLTFEKVMIAITIEDFKLINEFVCPKV